MHVSIPAAEYARLLGVDDAAKHFTSVWGDLCGLFNDKPSMLRVDHDSEEAWFLFASAITELGTSVETPSIYADERGLRKIV